MRDSKIDRRQMIAGGLAALAGATLASSCRSYAKKGPQKGARGFKLGVCDWTVRKRTDPEALEVARRIGIDGVQVDFGSGEEDLPLFDPDLQKRYIEAAKANEIEIASLAMGTLNSVPYKSDPRTDAWVERAIGVSGAMGTNVILLAFFGKGDLKNDPAGTDAVVRKLRAAAPRAEDAGVYLGIESWLNAEEHMAILERVDSPAVKVYYDVANSHKMGYDIYSEIRQLSDHICEFHAKDNDNLYGMGSIAFREVRKAMDDIGYRGWLIMEGTKMPLGVEESCTYDAKYLRTIFPRKV